MTQKTVGLAWRTLSDEQKKRVWVAFARYMTATYADRFHSYSGEKFEVTGQQNTPYGTIVESRIVKSNGDPVSINYLMRQNSGEWQVGDIYLTGAISQLATLRSQFASVLEREGVPGLITLLNNKAQALMASPASLAGRPARPPPHATPAAVRRFWRMAARSILFRMRRITSQAHVLVSYWTAGATRLSRVPAPSDRSAPCGCYTGFQRPR